MSGLWLPVRRPRRQQPASSALRIDSSNPLAEGLMVLTNAAAEVDHVSGKPLTRNGSMAVRGCAEGIGAIASGVGGNADALVGPAPGATTGALTDIALVYDYQRTGAGTIYRYPCGTYDGTGGVGIIAEHSSIAYCWGFFDAPSARSSGELLPTGLQFLAMTRASTLHRLYRNGEAKVEVTSSSSTTTAAPWAHGNFRATSGTFSVAAPVLLTGRWHRALSADEIAALADNPWQLIDGEIDWVWAPIAGGGAITGTASFSESSDTAAASGRLLHRGTGAITEANDTAAASGRLLHRGTGAITEANDTATASGRLIHYGSAAFTESNDTAAATGSVGTTGVYGDVAFAESDDILAALGRIIHLGTATITEADDTFAAVGRLIHRGTGSFVEDDDTLEASDADPLHGFTQDQLDFLVMYMEANMAIPTASQIAAAIYANTIDGKTLTQHIRLLSAVTGGKVSGAGTGTETFRDIADTKNRIVATVDSSGNRTAITLDLD